MDEYMAQTSETGTFHSSPVETSSRGDAWRRQMIGCWAD